MKYVKFSMPLGMLSSIAYFIHVFLGQMLWKDYNPITTDISSLTASGAPNADLLRIFTTIYGLCFLLFTAGMLIKATYVYHSITKIGYVIFFIMALTTVIGYNLFPLTGDKTVMTFQNLMHIIVTIVVVFTTIISLFCIAIGYLRKDKLRSLGRICLIIAILITVLGMLNPIGMGMELNILGLSERLVIFTLQAFVFFLSYIYTFGSRLLLIKIDLKN
jgi:heme A synthase